MGFMDGLGEILGGFNAARRIDKEGFDWREQAAQAEWQRQREQEQARQADEDRLTAQLGDVLAGQEGDPNATDIESIIPGEVDQARKAWMAKVALGQLPERKSRIESSKAQAAYNKQLLAGDQRLGQIGATVEGQKELAQLRAKLAEGRQLSPSEQAKMDALERMNQARITASDRRAAAGRENARHMAGMGTLRPLTDDEGRIYGFYNNRSGEYIPAEEGLAGARTGPVPTVEREKRSALQGIIADTQYLAEIAPRHRDKIGKFQGPTSEFMQNWVGGDPEAIDLFSISDNISDQLLRARSGAQINEQEYARLRKITPNPRSSEDKFFADLRRFEFEIARLLEQRTSPQPGRSPVTSPRPTGPLGGAPTGSPPVPPPETGGGMPQPRSKAEYDALPSGTRYKAPDGTIKVKR